MWTEKLSCDDSSCDPSCGSKYDLIWSRLIFVGLSVSSIHVKNQVDYKLKEIWLNRIRLKKIYQSETDYLFLILLSHEKSNE